MGDIIMRDATDETNESSGDYDKLEAWPHIFFHFEQLLTAVSRRHLPEYQTMKAFYQDLTQANLWMSISNSLSPPSLPLQREAKWLNEELSNVREIDEEVLDSRHMLDAEAVYLHVIVPIMDVMRQELVELIENERVGPLEHIEDLWNEFFNTKKHFENILELNLSIGRIAF
ncbi:MAG: hypothetical protein Q9159_000319 [Coniocarpon cinnabarinum]